MWKVAKIAGQCVENCKVKLLARPIRVNILDGAAMFGVGDEGANALLRQIRDEGRSAVDLFPDLHMKVCEKPMKVARGHNFPPHVVEGGGRLFGSLGASCSVD